MTDQRVQKLKLLLRNARHRLITMQPYFAAPLYDFRYVATKDVQRISTNGDSIYFDPDWLQKRSSAALDFMLSHQLMHLALGHIERPLYFKGDRFHLACDIVANDNLSKLGWKYDWLPGVGTIYRETFYPRFRGSTLTAQEALPYVPLDPATMSPGVRRTYMIDSDEWWDRKTDRGEAGIVVLAPGEQDPDDLAIDKTTGGEHFYFEKEMFYPKVDEECDPVLCDEDCDGQHNTDWDKSTANELSSLRDMLSKDRAADDPGNFRERFWQRPNDPTLDWRRLLDIHVQTEVNDYSFTPPDRRLQDSDFLLPDYNLTIEKPKEVLFMVDTSCSVEEAALSAVYAELGAALEQFQGGLIGLLGFFDTKVYRPIRFADVNDLSAIAPVGGGGTDYQCVFDYVRRNMDPDTLASMVIFTDGEATFPDEAVANNIPVLWLMTDNRASAPWGKSAYLDMR